MSDGVAASSAHGIIGATHPMLAGHFPGHPIVPGAWLLAWIVAEAERRCAPRKVSGVKRAKFLRPLAPDQAFECAFNARVGAHGAADTLRFTVTHQGAVMAEGALQLRAPPPD